LARLLGLPQSILLTWLFEDEDDDEYEDDTPRDEQELIPTGPYIPMI
jgi:hypothetical protein